METLSSCWRTWKQHYSGPSGRAGELFAQSLRQIQARTDDLLYYVLLIQYPAAIVVALIWSPLAWAGSRSSTDVNGSTADPSQRRTDRNTLSRIRIPRIPRVLS